MKSTGYIERSHQHMFSSGINKILVAVDICWMTFSWGARFLNGWVLIAHGFSNELQPGASMYCSFAMVQTLGMGTEI